MGFGDEIMATGFARKEKQKFPNRQIIIGDYKKKFATKSEIFLFNPNIVDPKKLDYSIPIHFVNNHPGNRPYIAWENTKEGKYIWNFNFKPIPGDLYFSENEIFQAKKIVKEAEEFWGEKKMIKHKGIIFLESSSTKIKNKLFQFKHRNKDWGENNWSSLVKILNKDYLIVQSMHENSKKLDEVFYCETNFRIACAVMKFCDLYVGPEGGFGHAAAALRIPAVIIFGGWIHPQVTGYDFHENIYIDIEGSPCGVFGSDCNHCKKCMKKITVEMIVIAINENISKK